MVNDKYYIDELEAKTIDTVDRYLTENNLWQSPILLSGGFDSGFLAYLADSHRGYRMNFPYGTLFDESRYAEAIANHLEMDLNDIYVYEEDFKENFDDAIKVMGEVTTHFSLVPLYILFKTLKERGVEDILSGEGPDEYLGGYARQIIFDELNKLYRIPELRNYHGTLNGLFGTNLVQMYAEMMGYPKIKARKYSLMDYPLQGKIGKMDMELGHIETMEQRMAEHFGIKIHYPYINEEYAEYCYKLPDRLKIRDGVTKWAFKQVALKYLPDMLKGRQKMGGPVAPVNKLMGWDLNPFDKKKYLEYQRDVLDK